MYIKCDENGNFISAGEVSTGNKNLQEVKFNEDCYIIAQGYITDSPTRYEYRSVVTTNNISIDTVYAIASSLYVDFNKVTIDQLVVKEKDKASFIMYANGDSSSHQAVTYTFDISNRVLVIDTLDWSIKTRTYRTSCLPTDYILLVYSSDNVFYGGALLAQYVESRDKSITPSSFTEIQCRNRFYLAMQERCKNYGIENAIIEGPSGYGAGGEVEPEVLTHGQAQMPIWGLTKLALISSEYEAIEQTMADAKYNIYVKGAHARTILADQRIIHSEYGTDLTDYYDVMFTKGGTKAGEALNLSAICSSPDFDGKLLLGVLRTTLNADSATYNRYKAMKLLMDIGKAKIANPLADVSSLETQMLANSVANAVVMIVPYGNARLYHDIDFSNTQYKLYGYSDTSVINTMSMIKYLTAMITLDYVKDLDEQVTIIQNDISASAGGSGQVFQAGDIVTYRDLLFALMSISSNPAGYALARLVGNKLLSVYGENGFMPIS